MGLVGYGMYFLGVKQLQQYSYMLCYSGTAVYLDGINVVGKLVGELRVHIIQLLSRIRVYGFHLHAVKFHFFEIYYEPRLHL